MARPVRLPLPELALVGLTLAWGASFAVIRRSLVVCDVMTLTFLRMTIACVFLLAVRPRALFATALEWRAGVLGGLLLAGGYVLQTAGMLDTSAGESGFLTAFYVTLVPVVEGVVYRRIPSWRDLAALAIATIGILVMSMRADRSMSLGEGLIALSAFLWAAQIVVVGRVATRVDPLRLALIQLLVVAVVGAAGAAGSSGPPVRWTGELVAAVLFLGVATNAIGFVVQAWAQKRVAPTRTAVLFSGEPVFAVLFGVWFMNEELKRTDVLGGAIVLAAVALAVLKPRVDVATDEAAR